VPGREAIKALYRKRARDYDWTANLYYLIGYLEWAYRRRAVAAHLFLGFSYLTWAEKGRRELPRLGPKGETR